MKMIFHSHANKTHFQKKGCTPDLISESKGFFLMNNVRMHNKKGYFMTQENIYFSLYELKEKKVPESVIIFSDFVFS